MPAARDHSPFCSENTQVLRITRPYLIDAKGTRRDAGIEYRDGVVRIQLDTAGLTYPVLLDPAVETAAWELRSSPPGSRYEERRASLAPFDRIVSPERGMRAD